MPEGVAISTRDGAGGVPLDAARPALVSELFVGEAPGDGSAAGSLCPGAIAQVFGDPFLVLPITASLA